MNLEELHRQLTAAIPDAREIEITDARANTFAFKAFFVDGSWLSCTNARWVEP